MNPNGIEISNVSPVTASVPDKRARMPNSASSYVGYQRVLRKKSLKDIFPKTLTPSDIRKKNIPNRITIVSRAAPVTNTLEKRSILFLLNSLHPFLLYAVSVYIAHTENRRLAFR